jgi:diaminohydroxyphosphoribosylaminopyrimidine deaminase/5-amino-6-(5-phosphoribosylamino)uracil reductase
MIETLEMSEHWMRLALREARKGLGRTSPNPAVGAILVRNGVLLSKGWHRGAGKPHAEVEALRALRTSSDACGATLYVTLEPCSTTGRTPPCTEAIVAARISEVVIGTLDPNPKHAGRALRILRKAGIRVRTGVLEHECKDLIKGFAKWITTGMPWVIAKAGQSLDGRLTRPPGEGQWLTSDRSRRDAMRLRAEVDAVLVGGETLRRDNPRLTVRPERKGRRQPLRVVWSPSGRVPKDAHVFSDEHAHRTVVCRDATLRSVLARLASEHQVLSVLLEGGGRTLGAAFDEKLADEVRFYYAPLLCGGPVPSVGGLGAGSNEEAVTLAEPRFKKIGRDVVLSAKVLYHR